MTTINDLKIILDVTSNNEVYRIKETTAPHSKGLGVALKLYNSHLDFLNFDIYYSKAFEEIISKIISKFQNYKVWLLIDRSVVVNSKAARYKKIWKALEISNIQIPSGKRTEEYVVEHEDRICFYGAICLDDFDGIQIANLIGRGVYGCMAITLNNNQEITSILKNGWGSPESNIYGYPKEIIQSASVNSIFFVRPIGAFDDKEWGAVVLAQSSLIERCFC